MLSLASSSKFLGSIPVPLRPGCVNDPSRRVRYIRSSLTALTWNEIEFSVSHASVVSRSLSMCCFSTIFCAGDFGVSESTCFNFVKKLFFLINNTELKPTKKIYTVEILKQPARRQNSTRKQLGHANQTKINQK